MEASRILEAVARKHLALRPGVQQGCSPAGEKVSISVGRARSVAANLALAFPVTEILHKTSSADVHLRASTDEHVAGRDGICDRWMARIVSRQPYCNRDVVGSSAKGYWEEAVQTQEKLCAAVVICCKTPEGRRMSDGSWERVGRRED